MHSIEELTAVLSYMTSQIRRASRTWTSGKMASLKMLALMIQNNSHLFYWVISSIVSRRGKLIPSRPNNGVPKMETSCTMKLQLKRASVLTMLSLRWLRWLSKEKQITRSLCQILLEELVEPLNCRVVTAREDKPRLKRKCAIAEKSLAAQYILSNLESIL